MNAGGVVQTCKSNEIVQVACYLDVKVANGCVTRKEPTLIWGIALRKKD